MGRISVDLSKGIIVLSALLEGKCFTVARLALDTGASNVMIPWKMAIALGLHPEISSERIETVTPSGIEIVPVVYIPLIHVLGEELRNVKAVVHDLPEKSYVDGLLGLSFLKQFKVTLDFKSGYIEIN